MAERAGKNPYKQFWPGQRLPFTLHTLNPDGSICSSDKQVEIAAIKGGGFFGRVLILKDEDFVIKTSVPDPWHDLWRRVNWGFKDFPSQVSETQARLDHLATNLIADVVPVVTEGKFHSPHSRGYTRLANGYAQVIERAHGREPRYDVGEDEFSKFRWTQEDLTGVGLNLGLEQIGQVHTDNPFGMANIWYEPETSRWAWFDTLPAIRHTGWVWPLFYFRFHKDIRNWFYPNSNEVTFNKIHSDLFLQEVQEKRHLFKDDVYQKVLENLNLYQQLWEERQAEGKTKKNFRATTTAAFESAKVVPQILLNGRGIKTGVRAIFDANLRRAIVNNTILAGTKKAFEEGVIDQDELEQAQSIVETPRSGKILPVLTGVYGYNQGSNWLFLKPAEIGSYIYLFGTNAAEKLTQLDLTPLLSLEDPVEKFLLFGLAFAGFRAVGMANSYLGTKLIGRLSDLDLETAARISAVPIVGSHLAIPAQFAITLGSQSEIIWHYNVRGVIAATSSIHPAGGWGTQLEGVLWKKVGKFLEGWAHIKR